MENSLINTQDEVRQAKAELLIAMEETRAASSQADSLRTELSECQRLARRRAALLEVWHCPADAISPTKNIWCLIFHVISWWQGVWSTRCDLQKLMLKKPAPASGTDNGG